MKNRATTTSAIALAALLSAGGLAPAAAHQPQHPHGEGRGASHEKHQHDKGHQKGHQKGHGKHRAEHPGKSHHEHHDGHPGHGKHRAPQPTEEPTPEPEDEAPAPVDPAPAPVDPAPEQPVEPEAPVSTDAQVQAVLEGHNTYRAQHGLAPLELSPELSQVSQSWTQHMAESGQLTHNPSYTQQIPAGWSGAAENIAYTPGTAADLVALWINSPSHEANMRGDFSHVGIGVVERDGQLWATVNFADYDQAPEPEVVPVDVEEPEVIEEAPVPAPATGGVTGGTGGTVQAGEEQTFTSANGLTSRFRVYTPSDQGTAPGLLMYTDGTGAYGYENPNHPYLLGGPSGLAAVAEAQNMILVVPVAPGAENIWYDRDTDTAAAKAQWSSDLMDHIKGQYNINQDRIAIGGYSSGAQWTTQFFLPAHGQEQSVDLAVAIAYGGAPRVEPVFTGEYAAATTVVFNTGTNDPGAYQAAQAGASYYANAGFTVAPTYPQGVTHDRGEEFGGIVNAAITEHLG